MTHGQLESFPGNGKLRRHTDIVRPASQIVASDPRLTKAWNLAFSVEPLSHTEWTRAIMDLANSDQPVVQAVAFAMSDSLCDQGHDNARNWSHRHLPGLSLAARSLLVNIAIAYSEDDGTTKVRCIGEQIQRITGVSLPPPTEFTPRALYEWLARILKSADDNTGSKEKREAIHEGIKILDELSLELVPVVTTQNLPSNPGKDVATRTTHFSSHTEFPCDFKDLRWVIVLAVVLFFGWLASNRFRN